MSATIKKSGRKPKPGGSTPARQVRIAESDWNHIIRAAAVMTKAGKPTTASAVLREGGTQLANLIIQKYAPTPEENR